MIKKNLLIGAMIGLVPFPLVLIAAEPSTLVVSKKIPQVGQWYDAPGTQISDGSGGVIFQAENGDLYAMGTGSGLEVLKKGTTKFIPAPGTQIENGKNGIIFQAENGDLYAMGTGSGLEVLEDGKDNFMLAPGTNIKDGEGGVIFQAKNGDLYAMGAEGGLDVLEEGTTRFKSAPGSEIQYGDNGVIFQAKNEDLYAMGKGSGLEVLEQGESEFKKAPGTSIINGWHGMIFEVSNKGLYAMGAGSGLEVLERGATQFKLAPGSRITNGKKGIIFQASNRDVYVMGYKNGLEVLKQGEDNFIPAPGTSITNGTHGTIFQAKNGDLYAMGKGSGLEVLKEGEDSFMTVPGARIKNGEGGVIFQAKNGDLYAMGDGSGLEVLKDGKDNFMLAPGTNIKDGEGGVIFQAKNGDLYAMGKNSKLQILKNNKLEFEITKTFKNINNGIIKVKNFINKYSKLQYKLSSAPTWINVPSNGEIQNLAPGAYDFQWVGKNGEAYAGGTNTSLALSHQVVIEVKKIPLPSQELNFVVSGETTREANDGSITVTNFDNLYSQLQYKLSSASSWINVPSGGQITGLAPGTYNFQWVGKHGEAYAGGTDQSAPLGDQIINDSSKIVVPPEPSFALTHLTAKGGDDGSITVTNFDNLYSQLQYKLSSASSWINVPSGGQITGLAPGTYNFQWVGKHGEAYAGGKLAIELPNRIVQKFKTSNIVQEPKTSKQNLAVILGTTIPISLISIGVVVWLVWHFVFKSKKSKK